MERFNVFVKFGWQIFHVTSQETIRVALDKNQAKSEISDAAGSAFDTTISAAGMIAGNLTNKPWF